MSENAKARAGNAGNGGAGVVIDVHDSTPAVKNRLMAAALRYAEEHGFRVFPLKPNSKAPLGRLVPNGVDNATSDPEMIRRWWTECPDANIGIAGGNGIAILDIDPRGGGDEGYQSLIDDHRPLPDTPQVLTGRRDGGFHLYLRTTKDIGNPNIAPGVQIKASGGYVVAPPSIHPDTGHPYQWEVSSHITDVPLAPMPEWLEALAERQDETEHDRSPGWFAEWMRTPIPEGGRRTPGGIPRAIGYLGGHGISIEETVAILTAWDLWNAAQCRIEPLGETEIRKHVENMYATYGYEPYEAPIRFTGKNGHKTDGSIPSEMVVRSLSTVETRQILWDWFRWLARRKLTIVGGVEGDGKSTLIAAIAAILSRGGIWPDGSQAPIGRILYLAAEDGIEDVLKPRLELEGANLDNILFVEAVKESETERTFNLAKHLPLLEDTALAYEISLIIIDPISSFMPSSNRNDEGEVRDLLGPLTKLAERTETAILGVMHLNRPNGTHRRASQRLLGSTAFGAIARMVWIIAPTSDDPNDTRRVLAVGKTNLGMKPKPLEWSVSGDDQPIVWHGESDLNVNELISGTSSDGRAMSPERLAVLRAVLDSDTAVGPKDIATQLDKSDSTVRNHLSALVDAGLIDRIATGMYTGRTHGHHGRTDNADNNDKHESERINFVTDVRVVRCHYCQCEYEPDPRTPLATHDPAECIRTLYRTGVFDDMPPMAVDGVDVIPLRHAKELLDNAGLPGHDGLVARKGLSRFRDVIEPMIEAVHDA